MSERKFKVVTPKYSSVPSLDLEQQILARVNADVVEIDASSEEAFIAGARDADAIIARGAPITRRVIENLERCQIVAFPGIGVDSIDVRAATEHGIIVTNVPDILVDEVADHALMFVLACAKKLTRLDRLMHQEGWSAARQVLPPMPRITGLTLGLVAFGNIPRAVAQRARAFGLHRIAYDPYVSELIMRDREVEPVTTLEELFSRADFVSAHLPLTDETYHLINEDLFRVMKPTAYFINTGRGPTVDEAALIKALQEGWIAGAALDVFEKEPPDNDNPLLQMDNVIVTPHCASYSDRFRLEARRRVSHEIASVLSGRWPLNPVNPSVRAKARMTVAAV